MSEAKNIEVVLPNGKTTTIDMSGRECHKYDPMTQFCLAVQSTMIFVATNRLTAESGKLYQLQINEKFQIQVSQDNAVVATFDTRMSKSAPLTNRDAVNNSIRERVLEVKDKPITMDLHDLLWKIYDIENVSDVFIREAFVMNNAIATEYDKQLLKTFSEYRQASASGQVH